MYTKAAVLATNATPLPMWDPEGYRMVPLPNMVADFRDRVTLGNFEIDFLTEKSVGERNEWIIDVDALPVLGGSPLDNFDLFERVHAEFLLVDVTPFFLSMLQPVGSPITQS